MHPTTIDAVAYEAGAAAASEPGAIRRNVFLAADRHFGDGIDRPGRRSFVRGYLSVFGG